MSSRPGGRGGRPAEDGLSNGAGEAGAALRRPGEPPLPEVSCSPEEDVSYEVQQAQRIFSGLLLDKHKGVTGPFFNPVGHQEAQRGAAGVGGRGQAQLRQSMCLRRMEEKFRGHEYETITEFVGDFRLMLENCYRYHGVDHWVSRLAQRLELLLEQKLTLLSRTLREKTTLAVTSKGRFGTEEERGPLGSSTRRRMAPRSLATLTVSGHESVMVQALRLEEQQRAREEKRQRELEKKEAEETSAKEVEEWEQGLLAQASPQAVDMLWELPAIGHFLCLAQTALNLPEVVFFQLERCLLMPRCSPLLSKIMSSLLSPAPRRATLHRRPTLPYHRWEAELRQRVGGWYRAVGASRHQPRRAEQLGLCHQFFRVLGEASPLELRPFHLLPFYQRVWLLKGLCDHVYETQSDVQDAVLAQPIHECRESILGYDSKENAYIHFPHFCGADLRIYRQSPSTPPAFPSPPQWVRPLEKPAGAEGEESEGEGRNDGGRSGAGAEEKSLTSENLSGLKEETHFESWSRLKQEVSDSDCEIDLKTHNCLSVVHVSAGGGGGVEGDSGRQSKRFTVKQQQLESLRTAEAQTPEPSLNVGEHSYTGRSPARPPDPPADPPPPALWLQTEAGSPGRSRCGTSCPDACGSSNDRRRDSTSLTAPSHPDGAPKSTEAGASDRIWRRKRRRKKKRGRGEGGGGLPEAEPNTVSTNVKRKERKKKHKTGRRSGPSHKTNPGPAEPSFQLVCSSLEELRGLISKMEDELDELESTKKRLGRWYYRREAVKDLHSTLIRLLNELSPWEPKLIKAHQRNRLRLKKEFDDFKKQPEYNNFVREECISSSSAEEQEDEERELGKEACSPADDLEEEDLEHLVPRGLWSGASSRGFGVELPAENHLHPPGRHVGLLPQGEGPEASPPDPCRDSASVSPRSPPLPPPKRYTPIPTLLAKSVGNKVTLMRRPADFPGVGDAQSRGSSPFLPGAAGTTNPPEAQSPRSGLHQGPAQTQTLGQPRTRAAPPPPTQTVPKDPVQVLYRVPEGRGHLVKKDGSSPIRFSVQPVLDQNSGEKIMQQVVILPPNLLVQKAEAKTSPESPHQPATGPRGSSASCLSTDVPGFRIPVQPVAPLRDARPVSSPPPSALPGLQQGTVSTSGGVKTCRVPATKPGVASNPPPITSLPAALSTEPLQAADLKQELKTVCIRDSQSILVTTRGGNTGIVRVQTSSDSGGFGSFPSSPVITISPQFKAFLVSKTSPALPPPAAPPTPCTHKQTASIPKPPPTGPGSPSATRTAALTQGSLTPVAPTFGAKLTRLTQTASASVLTQPAAFTSCVVPSLSSSDLLAQELVSKAGLKRSSGDEGAQVSKFILVTPSSSSTSNVALPKGPAPSPQSVPGSRVMIIGQPTAVSSITSSGSSPKQPIAAPTEQAMAASAPSHLLKMGSGGGPPPAGGSEASPPARNVTPPSGFQIQLSGKMAASGQSISSLSFSPSKPASDSASANGPVSVTSLIPFTSCSSLPGRRGSPTSSAPPPCTSKDLILSSSPAHSASSVPDSRTSFTQSGVGGETASTSSRSKVPPLLPPAGCSRFSACGLVQQRIVINTSTPLAAGTQILLNNACFVVPPQGLGPGSHVLLISSPQQTPPPAAAPSPGASLPFLGAGNPGVLPHCGAGRPAGAAGAPSFVSPSLLSTPPRVPAARLTGAPLPSNTNVVPALPRCAARQAGKADSHSSGSPAPAAAGAPPFSPDGAPPFSPAGAPPFSPDGAPPFSPAVRRPAATQAAGPSAASPAVASTLASTFPRLPALLSSLPLLPSPLPVALPVPALPSSAVADAAAPLLTGISLGADILPLQAAAGAAAPPPRQPQAGLPPIRKQGSATQPVLSATRTQEPPTVAVPPIVSAASRIQTLPVATVPPIGGVAAAAETIASPDTAPGRPITSLKTIGCGKLPPPAAALGLHSNMASRLLAAPHGAILSIVQSHVGPAELTTNSPSAASATRHSSLPPVRSDAK